MAKRCSDLPFNTIRIKWAQQEPEMPAHPSRLTTLSYALLGLIRIEPRSGYGLRRVFETTPMGNYSSSPGSIYPALKVLSREGLIESRPAKAGKSVFALTDAGTEAFETWLKVPVTQDDVAQDISGLLMRFAMLQTHPDKGLTLDFLRGFTCAAEAQVNSLKAFLLSDAGRAMPDQAQWAVRHGVMSFEASLNWSREALAALEATDFSHTN
jgi:DNA-binding PadR family transcriptional regulator